MDALSEVQTTLSDIIASVVTTKMTGETLNNNSVMNESTNSGSSRPLDSKFNVYFSKRGGGLSSKDKTEYETMIKPIGSFDTVETFWANYNHMVRPSDLPGVDLSVFLDGVRPLWEDEANKAGGKFLLRVKKGLTSRCWENLLMALIGGQFDVPTDEICGVNLSIRYSEDIISIWVKTSSNPTYAHKIKSTIREVLFLPHFISIDFKSHFGGKDSAAKKAAMKHAAAQSHNNRLGSFRGSSDVRLEKRFPSERHNNQNSRRATERTDFYNRDERDRFDQRNSQNNRNSGGGGVGSGGDRWNRRVVESNSSMESNRWGTNTTNSGINQSGAINSGNDNSGLGSWGRR